MVSNNSKSKNIIHQVSITVPCEVDTGSDGSIMPLQIYKRLFSREAKEQLAASKIRTSN